MHVWSYVKGGLDALLSGETNYASLRADQSAASHPEHIRTCRQEERRDRADRNEINRAARRAIRN